LRTQNDAANRLLVSGPGLGPIHNADPGLGSLISAPPASVGAFLLLHRLLGLGKFPVAEFEMLEDRLRDCDAVLLFQLLTKAGDRHLLKREGNVERETLVAGPNDQ
jgi:hypothetical protein